MKKVFEKIKTNPLFKGINSSDFENMMGCLEARVQNYKKGEIILLAGNPVEAVGLVVSGSVQVIKEDSDGRQNLLAEVGVSKIFGEVFACSGILHSPVTVRCAQDCQILFINYRRIINVCTSACCFHSKLIENMLALIAQKNLLLNNKIEILSKRTIRERLLTFFELYNNGEKKFSIPYNREELAAFICVDRSAMSAELSKMQKEGLIEFNRNEFEILF